MYPDTVSELITALYGGDENAFNSLIEAPHDIIPILIDEYEAQMDGQSRAHLVEVIWQRRQPSTTGFLASALADDHTEVWKQALDGLVTIDGTEASAALEKFKANISSNDERAPWVDEALKQLGASKQA